MPEVVAVKLRFNPKVLWFAAPAADVAAGDHVIVETERGTEIGEATGPAFSVQEEELPAALKPVVRVASDEDLDIADDLDRRAEEALPVFREYVERYNLDMKPVDVEFLFDGSKAIFYFVAEERVDFRVLVRELATRFRMRIDMRQIGVRDEARIVGGIAHCGQEFCCTRFGSDFQPVSIRMAKEQDLPLNPVKISGACGRLMCCLRHEFDAYKDFKGRAPKRGAQIETPLGAGKVTSLDTPREVVNIRLEDGKNLNVPLEHMECGKDGCSCPCKVSREALQEIGDPSALLALSSLEREAELAEIESEKARAPRTRRRRSGGGDRPAANEPVATRSVEEKSDKPKPSRRSRRGRRGGSSSSGGGESSQARSQQAPEARPEQKSAEGGSGTDAPKSTGGRRRRRR